MVRWRIIPTYVGSTARTNIKYCNGANHSHVCGINLFMFPRLSLLSESFPRMWDQQDRLTNCRLDLRIIPTYVGSTASYHSADNQLPNHSHVCGINAEGYLPQPSLTRIIPTYVGSTSESESRLLARSNHSHVCGINQFLHDIVTVPIESFPRMWDQRRLRILS